MSPDPTLDNNYILLAEAEGTTLFSHALLHAVTRLPRPGIIIFVHGVNSDGEWYEQVEQGLCEGLNARLKRRNDDLAIPGPAAGQMKAATYTRELTDDGFLNPKRNATTFLQADDANSPVIRFRWGYKANGEELQAFGDGIYLNEKNYWGGGPFANGCSALPDLWGQGLSEELFLWMHIQHMNPTNDRQVYACPPRPYFVFAAWRLARLVQSIRACQHDAPVTIVCHSQGNMVAMAAAFLGETLGPSAVADSYVLCNPPYSLLDSNFTENWVSGHLKDEHGNTGRQKYAARTQTLKAFFNILRTHTAMQQDAAFVDECSANRKPERKDSYAPYRSQGKGDAQTEAALRYEQNGMLRMQARRDGWVEKGKPETPVDKPEEASKEFNAWRKQEIQNYLAANIDTHATDHSTIMTNPEHAQKALAYDVAVGVCTIRQEELRKLRVAADWSLLKGASFESGEFFEYYDNGTFKDVSLFTWGK